MSATIGQVKPYHEMTADELLVEADRIEDSAFDVPAPEGGRDGDGETPLDKARIALHFRRFWAADELRHRATNAKGKS